MSSVDPNRVRALVRQVLEEKFGLGLTASQGRPGSTALISSLHPSQLAIGEGPVSSDCQEDIDLPLQKPCLIEPHRPCYNSGYCRKLGH